MSLSDERRAIGAGITNSRTATGGAQRQAIGKRLESERRGAQVVADLNRLQRPPQQRRALRNVPPVGAIPAGRGRGNYTPPPEAGGGGIASPLIEVPDTRTMHPSRTVTTTDGMLVFGLRRVASITMLDANDAEVRMKFQNVSGA